MGNLSFPSISSLSWCRGRAQAYALGHRTILPLSGIEPRSSCVRRRHALDWAIRCPFYLNKNLYKKEASFESWKFSSISLGSQRSEPENYQTHGSSRTHNRKSKLFIWKYSRTSTTSQRVRVFRPKCPKTNNDVMP